MHTNTHPRFAWQSPNTNIANAIASPITGNPVAERLSTQLSQSLHKHKPALLAQVWHAQQAGQITLDQAEHLVMKYQQPAASCVEQSAGRKSGALLDASRRILQHTHSKPSYDRARSIERRNRNAACALKYIPPRIALHFTRSELSVFDTIVKQIRLRGRCDLAVGAIAALAGVCTKTVRRAYRHAQELKLLDVKERRLSATRNDTNIITITSAEWLAWLAMRPRVLGDKTVQPRPTSNSVGPLPRPYLHQPRYPNTRRPP